jgi:hypothetical protein
MSPSRPKSQLVLLDAGIVIEAFRLGAWEALIAKYRIAVSQTIVEEAHFYENDKGSRIPIDLRSIASKGDIDVIDVPASDYEAFIKTFNRSYAERLHAGELELLTHLQGLGETECQLCSADGIVFRVLGKMRISERGISLEELFNAIGITKTLEDKYKKEFRLRNTQIGFADSF